MADDLLEAEGIKIIDNPNALEEPQIPDEPESTGGDNTEGDQPSPSEGDPGSQEGSKKEKTQEQDNQQVNTTEPNLDWLSEQTGGEVTTAEDFAKVFEEYKTLKQTPPKSEPEFPNDGAKKAYELALWLNGDDPVDGMLKVGQLQKLDLDKMDPKEILFQKLLLDPEMSDLGWSEADLRDYFEQHYDENYNGGEFDGDRMAKLKYDKDLKEAKKFINDLKIEAESFNSGKQEKPDLTETLQKIDQTLKGYKGMEFKDLMKDQQEAFKFQIPQENLDSFKDKLADPSKMYESIIEKSMDENGNFDMGKYVMIGHILNDPIEFAKSLYSAAYDAGSIGLKKTLKNVETKTTTGDRGGDISMADVIRAAKGQ